MNLYKQIRSLALTSSIEVLSRILGWLVEKELFCEGEIHSDVDEEPPEDERETYYDVNGKAIHTTIQE